MLKVFRNTFTYLASTIVALHLLIPHAHCEELTTKNHNEFHEQQEGTLIDYLSFIFHEYTEDGDMEHFVPDQDFFDFSSDLYVLPSSFFRFLPTPILEDSNRSYCSPLIQHFQPGILACRGNRPPPIH